TKGKVAAIGFWNFSPVASDFEQLRLLNRLDAAKRPAKRELDFLRSTGAIEFIGPSKTGGYQLRLVMSE
ncbi:MAG: hypothetical protein ACK5OB_16345, partial [Pirellula sp.]